MMERPGQLCANAFRVFFLLVEGGFMRILAEGIYGIVPKLVVGRSL